MSSERKKEHVDIVLKEKVSSEYNYWNDINLIHKALPELDLSDIDTSTTLFGQKVTAPLIISAMTGGFKGAERVNSNLAEAAARVGIGMGVGSQRQALEDESLVPTYSVIKDHGVPLRIANIGAPQLIEQEGEPALTLKDAERAVQMVDAHILAIHLNFLQEVVQPEGDKRARGCLEAISRIASKIPVLAKETGAGISREVALELKRVGVAGIDVGGLGGTSFSAVEYYRARTESNRRKERLGRTFWNWGIPAPVSVVMADVGLPVVATGGIRSGLDLARAIVLGASAGGMASALLAAAKESADAVEEQLIRVLNELKAAMFLTGSADLNSLAERNCVITGPTAEWLRSLEVK